MVIQLFSDYLIRIISGYLMADFMVGIYHWIKDTYFCPFTPIIGKTLIWGSRLHHVRPRHVLEFTDWELFIGSAKWTSFWMIPYMFGYGIGLFNISLFLTISLNDVVHKYAHMFDNERPAWATYLQNIYIFQSHDEHHQHHTHPHEINYCPISPYVNMVLEKVNFWRNLESVIESVTGIKPRAKEYDFVEDPDYPAGIKFLDQ